MSLQRKYIKSLTGGVSEQPPSLRFDSQCEAQSNFLSDATKGLLKRPGTTWKCNLDLDITGNISQITPFDWISLGQTTPPFVHHIKRSGEEELLLVIHNTTIALFNATTGANIALWTDPAKTTQIDMFDDVGTHVDQYLDYSTGTYTIQHPYEAVNISDYTFIINKSITVAADSSTDTTGYATNGFIFIKEGEFATTYTVHLTDTSGVKRSVIAKTADTGTAGSAFDYKTSNIIAAIHWGLSGGSGVFNTTNASAYATEDTKIAVTYSDTGGTFTFADYDFVRDASGSSMFFKIGATPSGSDAPTISVEDSWGNSIANGGVNEVKSFDGLPVSCWNNFHLKVTGTPDSEFDDYYIKFVCDDSGVGNNEIGAGAWEESGAYGNTLYFNRETMPHVLVRIDAHNYWYGPLDQGEAGVDDGDGREQWSVRSAGDDTTNPFPSFVGQKINDIVFFKSRLGFLSGENLILSELDEPFNFFRTSVLQILDTDRIDIGTSVNEITELNFAVPFANQLIVFSDRSQFIVTYGNSGLTPSSATLSLITRYDASNLAKPKALDNSVIFARKKGGATDIMELYPTGATNTSFEARNLTSHVPSYIGESILDIIPSSMAQSILIRTTTLATISGGDFLYFPKLYVYKYYDKQNERVQSSWSTFTLEHSTTHLIHVHVDDEEYRMLALYPVDYEFVASTLHDGNHDFQVKYSSFRIDNTESFDWSLDDIVTDSDCTLTGSSGGYTLGYDAGNDWTIIKVPYGIPIAESTTTMTSQGYVPVIVDDSGVTGTIIEAPIPDAVGVNSSYDLIKVEGDWTGTTFTFGSSFECSYTFSKQYLKRQDAKGEMMSVIDGRTTIRFAEVYFSNSQYMKITATYPDMNRDSTSKSFSGTIVGGAVIGDQASETGTLRLFIGARNDVPVIVLSSDTHQKATITGASFSVAYNNRERNTR